MKRVVSVSLGSSARDSENELTLGGEPVSVCRIGADGNLNRYRDLLREWDGKADAIGLGGMDLWLSNGKRRYTLREPARLAAEVKQTPVVDGSGLKAHWEPWVIAYFKPLTGLSLHDQPAFMVSAVDRFPMARALEDAGARLIIGDLICAINVPIGLTSTRMLTIVATLLLPIIVRLPFQWLYPTGEKQKGYGAHRSKHAERAAIIAGDFHFIRDFLPADCSNKVIITNTVTAADIDECRRRGALLLVTTTPALGGRSFGANVIEAACVARAGRPLAPEELTAMLRDAGVMPRIEWLSEMRGE